MHLSTAATSHPVLLSELNNRGAGAVFFVRDNGHWDRPEYKEQIFELFKRLPATPAIDTREVVSGCQYASASSNITVAASGLNLSPDEGQPFTSRSLPPVSSPAKGGYGKQPMILLVEDNESTPFLVGQALKEHGVRAELTVLRDGEEAFQVHSTPLRTARWHARTCSFWI